MARRIKDIEYPMPVIPLRGMVIFPQTVTPIMVGRKRSMEALEYASSQDKYMFLVSQRNPKIEDPVASDLYRVGTIVKVVQVMRFPNGTLKALVEGVSRGRVERYLNHRGYIEAMVTQFHPSGTGRRPEIEALSRKTRELFNEYVDYSENLPDELAKILEANRSINDMADIISAQVNGDFHMKQDLLECDSLELQLDLLVRALAREISVLRFREDIDNRVQGMLDDNQREYILRQQMEAIRQELGDEAGGFEEEYTELEKLIRKTELPDHIRELLNKEFSKLVRTPITSPESAVTRSYIETLLEMPWFVTTEDSTDIIRAESILEEDHHGLKKVKERILEHIAVMSFSSKPRGPILCLVGPPGVGKTSIAKSVARALDRNFVRSSFGGLHDEAEIRGHRRTYVGAMPGKVITGIKRAESRNPVFLLDEIDKMGQDFRGDPAAALMEVLDPDQNYSFTDNYLEVPFDLSNVLFITTANTIQGIPEPLLDRMEMLRIPGYLESEKFIIARDYLVRKQSIHGLADRTIEFTDDGILTIIREYTREAGVRELERQIAAIFRKIAVEVSRDKRRRKFVINPEAVHEFLGTPKFIDSPIPDSLMPGEALGLAWTSVGGELLHIEVLRTPGKDKIRITGSLGDVMKESVEAAMSLVRSRHKEIGFELAALDGQEFHIHFPEGAVPKDGPSAGIAITCALTSALTGKPMPNDMAMTGEITLSGRVLAIGGLPEKLHAAKRFNLKRVIIPDANKKDLADIKPEVLEGMEIIPVKTIDDVFFRLAGALGLAS